MHFDPEKYGFVRSRVAGNLHCDWNQKTSCAVLRASQPSLRDAVRSDSFVSSDSFRQMALRRCCDVADRF
jgi:hypothetical protein